MKSRRTVMLAVISLVLSMTTFVMKEWFSMPELYPFFSWKLYTQPVCGTCRFSDFRVYGVSAEGDTIRIENKGYPAFSREDYNGFLAGEAARIEAAGVQATNMEASGGSATDISLSRFQRRLAAFGDAVTGGAFEHYLLVEEQFIPFDIKNADTFETRVLLSTTSGGTTNF